MTVNEALKKHKEDCLNCRDKACKLNHKCLQQKDIEVYEKFMAFEAIGTVEEFKALKEKNKPKKVAEHNFQDEPHHYLCPSCRSIVSCTQNHCDECGQALET